MASLQEWVAGARVRTLPAAVSPVVAGTGAAAAVGSASLVRALLALVVAMAMQIGVNYANDYSDGVRGTDAVRVGPTRLVGSGLTSAVAVRTAAWLCFGLAAVAGLALVALSGHWWLIAVGAVAIAAGWYYTGGRKPYGYYGLGEVSVFIFFGLVAVVGTTFTQVGRVTASAVIAGIAVGSLACAILVTNNLRDLVNDAVVGKRTLPVFLGSHRSRFLYAILMGIPYGLALALSLAGRPWSWLALLTLPLAVWAARPVVNGASGNALVPALQRTALTQLVYAVLLSLGLAATAP